LFAVSVPLFFLAAGIESFVRQSSLGTATRLGVAAAMLVLLGIGAFAVRRLSVRHDSDVVWLSDLR
jgi:hypothetical protein